MAGFKHGKTMGYTVTPKKKSYGVLLVVSITTNGLVRSSEPLVYELYKKNKDIPMPGTWNIHLEMVVSIGWFQIITLTMVGNHQTSNLNWLFGVPGGSCIVWRVMEPFRGNFWVSPSSLGDAKLEPGRFSGYFGVSFSGVIYFSTLHWEGGSNNTNLW